PGGSRSARVGAALARYLTTPSATATANKTPMSDQNNRRSLPITTQCTASAKGGERVESRGNLRAPAGVCDPGPSVVCHPGPSVVRDPEPASQRPATKEQKGRLQKTTGLCAPRKAS